eukprot:64773-Pyramimonas_sp.AAC.1
MAVSKRRDPRSRRRRSNAVNDMSLRPQGSRRVRKGLGPFPRKRARLQVERGGEAITAWKYPSRARL